MSSDSLDELWESYLCRHVRYEIKYQCHVSINLPLSIYSTQSFESSMDDLGLPFCLISKNIYSDSPNQMHIFKRRKMRTVNNRLQDGPNFFPTVDQ